MLDKMKTRRSIRKFKSDMIPKEIIEKIWDNANDVSNRTIDTNITRLRKKLGKYGSCITTRLGYGYGFQEQNID